MFESESEKKRSLQITISWYGEKGRGFWEVQTIDQSLKIHIMFWLTHVIMYVISLADLP